KAHGQIRDVGRIKLFRSHRSDYGDGEQKRDFIYVKDCVDVMLWLKVNPQVGGIFNLGTGQAKSWNDLARAVFGALALAPSIDYIDMPENIRSQYQYFTQAEMAKLQAAGYSKKFHSLEDGVRDYVINYLEKDQAHW